MNGKLSKLFPVGRSWRAWQHWLLYIASLIAWAAVMTFLLYGGWRVCQRFSWERTALWQALNWIRQNAFFVLFTSWAVGWLVISYYFISQPVRNLEELISAAERLSHPGEEPILLSGGMKDVQDQLNLLRERALRDAMAAKEAEQRKNDLIVYLAHDLKTPLTSVIGYLTGKDFAGCWFCQSHAGGANKLQTGRQSHGVEMV